MGSGMGSGRVFWGLLAGLICLFVIVKVPSLMLLPKLASAMATSLKGLGILVTGVLALGGLILSGIASQGPDDHG